ncbi:hypothetical protein DID88_007809 [Monilinia fructigena]|uniref:HTH CENPB-type domain-containing protein n=1 Tax=Monilinia fructigena TaxID=38457 RepID=A0A395J8J1_9HELO|nr:hypothetical protein DID88_007809 [Monilinia fructigena]
MHTESPLTPSQIEEKIQNAIIALQLKEFKSIRKAAEYFEVPKSTLIARVAGRKSRTQSHEMAQILSNAEENTLVRWISRLTITGFPATPMLVKEMADEIRLRRVQVARFYSQKSNWKVTAGKQEWITAFECVNAAGKALLPMVIFKAQNTNSAWIPKDTPQSWQFSTSTNGWTSNSHGLEWLKRVFEPESKKLSAGWRGAGLVPFAPRKVLDSLPFNSSQQPSTPQMRTSNQDLDLSILRSSPPDGTELRQANQTFNKALADNDSLASPTRRYAKRMTRLVESQNAEIALLRKQLADAQEVIETRKKRTKGKRVKLQGQFVFSSEEVLKMVREAEEKPKEKKPRGRPRKRPIEELEEETEEEEPDSSSSDLEWNWMNV